MILRFTFLIATLLFISQNDDSTQEVSQSKPMNQNLQKPLPLIPTHVTVDEVKKIHLTQGEKTLLLLKFNSGRRLNLNVQSYQARFGILYQEFDQMDQNKLAQQGEKFSQMASEIQGSQRINSNSDFKHYLTIHPNDTNQENILLILLSIPRDKTVQQRSHAFEISFYSFYDENFFGFENLQRQFQYCLRQNQTQRIRYTYSNRTFEELNSIQSTDVSSNLKKSLESYSTQPQLTFHHITLEGSFTINVSLRGIFLSEKGIAVETVEHVMQTGINPTSFVFESLDQTIERFIMSRRLHPKKQFKREIIEIFIEVTCTEGDCHFINELEQSSVRVLNWGVPTPYSVSSEQIFEVKNPLDLDFRVSVNKRTGSPTYKICSSRRHIDSFSGKNQKLQKRNSTVSDDCLRQLSSNYSSGPSYFLQINEHDEKLNLFGRTFKLQINPTHPSYCYRCSYFISLYSDYETVEGQILVMSSHSVNYLAEKQSISSIVSRNQEDCFRIFASKAKVEFEKISGWTELSYRVGYSYLEAYKVDSKEAKADFRPLKIEALLSQSYSSKQLTSEISTLNPGITKNVVFIDIKIKTLNSYPSALYQMVVSNEEPRKIVLRDGVPYLSKQSQKQLIFEYFTEKIKMINFGTIIVSSQKISNIELQIQGTCLKEKFQTDHSYTDYLINKNNFKNESEKYETVKILNQRVNLMASRIDVLIEPKKCKSYELRIVNKQFGKETETNGHMAQNTLDYQVLVSFVDSQLLPLNVESPGILKYPQKLSQTYEIFISQKTELSIWVNFCRAGKSRMHFYPNKQALQRLTPEKQIKFTGDSTLEESKYQAHPGVLYLRIQFLGFSSILQYTILVREDQNDEDFYYTDLSETEKQISYKVKQVEFSSTTYDIFFSPMFLRHWEMKAEKRFVEFETEYFILESNSYPLIDRAASCKGQFFSQIINHHEHFRQTKVNKSKLSYYGPSKSHGDYKKIDSGFIKYDRGFYQYEYETANPLSFLIVVPVILQTETRDSDPHVSRTDPVIIPYWKFNARSRQPYQITQLHNGKLFSIFEHLFESCLIAGEDIWDFHQYQGLILTFFCVFFGIPCCLCGSICCCRLKNRILGTLKRKFNKIKSSQAIAVDDIQEQRDSSQVDAQQSMQNVISMENSTDSLRASVEPQQRKVSSELTDQLQKHQQEEQKLESQDQPQQGAD